MKKNCPVLSSLLEDLDENPCCRTQVTVALRKEKKGVLAGGHTGGVTCLACDDSMGDNDAEAGRATVNPFCVCVCVGVFL